MNIFVIIIIYCVLCVFLVTHWEITVNEKDPLFENDVSTLLVIAHPDDETMFFGPLLVDLVSKRSNQVFILCLTSGNYYGLGSIRQFELVKATQHLGLSRSNVYINDQFVDGFDQIWNSTLIALIVQEKVIKHKITNVITFDETGVSGHSNHRDTHAFINVFVSSFKISSLVKFFVLETVILPRKYLSLFEVPISLIDWLLSTLFNQSNRKSKVKSFIGITPSNYLKLVGSLYCHKSQMVWFRQIYSLFSRYMFINTFVEYDH